MTEQIGRYVVKSEIGRGGFGKVYQAWDPVVHRHVAIKVLTSMSDPAILARFRSEAGTTGSLMHRNIITIYDFGEHEGAPYLVMELLDGRSLREVIDAGSLSIFEKVRILLEVAQGLYFAHQNNVIHRDIKPANIMLLADGTVKILDFGIARLIDQNITRHTSSGVLIGTVDYMAPEIFEGEDATRLSDVFSFGIVAYELLTGKPPFTAPSPVALIKLIATRPAESVRKLVPECPQSLETIVDIAMAKRPADRYQSLQELLFDLAPIEAELRKGRVDSLAAQAHQAFESGDLETAQQNLHRALELDATHPASQEVRRRIQRQRDKASMEQRLERAASEVQALLAKKSFDQAIQALETLRQWPAPEWTGYWQTNVDAQLATVRDAREKHLAATALLSEARQAAARHDLSEASEKAAQVLSIEPDNQEAQTLQRWVLEERAKELSAVPVTKPEPVAAPTPVATSAPPAPLPPQPPKSRISALTVGLAAAAILVVAAAGWFLLSKPHPQPGQPPAAAAQPDPHTALAGAIDTALAEQRWSDALDAIHAFQAVAPSDPRLAAWEQQASAGSERARQVETIRSITASAIESKDWKAAAKGIEELVKAAPNDPQVLAWQQLLNDGKQQELAAAMRTARDNRINTLRSAVDMALSRRDYKAARKNLDELQKVLPGDRTVADIETRMNASQAEEEKKTPPPPVAETPVPAVAAPAVPKAPEPAAPPRTRAILVNPKDGLKYVWIAPGKFQMGCSPGDPDCLDREKPAHLVTITHGYWMGQTEVTQDAYRQIRGANPSNFKGPKLPVDNVSWEDARNYCEAVGLRLPTEAEWEYAARAGVSASRSGDLDGIAWQAGNSGSVTHEVAKKSPNAWGLYDMLGNLWEWVNDWFAEQYAPAPATDPQGPPSGTYRVLRGASLDVAPRLVRLSHRLAAVPSSHGSAFGIRCAGN